MPGTGARLALGVLPLLSGCAGREAMWGAAFGVLAVLAALVVGLGARRLGELRAATHHQAELQAARAEAAALRRLAQGPGGMCWRSDTALTVEHVEGASLPAAASWPGAKLTRLVADAQAADGPSLAALLAAGAQIAARPVRLSGAAADAPPLELAATPLVDAEGRFAGYLGVLREAPAAGATDAGASPDDALAFSYTLSHDLRAPVRVVEGFTRIVKEDYGAQIDRVGNDHLDRVLSAAARMNQMIDALLAMARLSTQPLQRQPVDLTQLAGFVIDELKRGAPERRIEFDVEPGMQVQGDPTLLRQMLENLLGNAWKYTQRAAEPRVRFGRELVDGRAAFVVQDNGAGFDMRSVERLFGLFQRLHSASDFPGTGVGLASVKRIVARHGGRIWAGAEPGRGATFHFTLKD